MILQIKNSSVTIDDCDYDKVKDFKWTINTRGYVAVLLTIKGRRCSVKMHSLILPKPTNLGWIEIDHIDNNKLNNTRANLRLATQSQNNFNRPKCKGKNKYKGSYFNKRRGWHSEITLQQKTYYLLKGSEVECAFAYNVAALLLAKEYAQVNTITEPLSDNIKQQIERTIKAKLAYLT
jgi:hypothetical protein